MCSPAPQLNPYIREVTVIFFFLTQFFSVDCVLQSDNPQSVVFRSGFPDLSEIIAGCFRDSARIRSSRLAS